MGINTHVYTVYGFKTEWDDDFYEAREVIEEELYDKYKERKHFPKEAQIDSVIDSMCGSFMAFGKILYDSGDFRWCDEMNNFQELDVSDENLKKIKSEYKAKFEELYPNFIHLIKDKEWKVLNLIHYS